MKISIIVPVYNAELYLSRCVESIKRQTYRSWELLLVDDGATDRSGEICDDYAKSDNRIKVFHNENSGAAAARYYGVKKAVGDYLVFVDADDSLPDNSLSQLYLYSNKYGVDIAVGGYTRIYPDQKSDYCALSQDLISGHDFLLLLVSGNWRIYGPVAKLFKKELFLKAFPYIPKAICVGEDLLMNIHLATQAHLVVFVPYSVYNYHQVATSMMHSFKYTVDYMHTYLSVLREVLIYDEVADIDNLLCHYKINMCYNVILDDAHENLDYQSSEIKALIKESASIVLTRKEQTILCLLKSRFFRVIFRKIMANYRRGNTYVYQTLKRLLGK